jgi:hypothetical protein
METVVTRKDADNEEITSIPDDWLVVTIKTVGGRIVNLLREESVQPGDCDYYMYEKDVRAANELVNQLKNGTKRRTSSEDIAVLLEKKMLFRNNLLL